MQHKHNIRWLGDIKWPANISNRNFLVYLSALYPTLMYWSALGNFVL